MERVVTSTRDSNGSNQQPIRTPTSRDTEQSNHTTKNRLPSAKRIRPFPKREGSVTAAAAADDDDDGSELLSFDVDHCLV